MEKKIRCQSKIFILNSIFPHSFDNAEFREANLQSSSGIGAVVSMITKIIADIRNGVDGSVAIRKLLQLWRDEKQAGPILCNITRR